MMNQISPPVAIPVAELPPELACGLQGLQGVPVVPIDLVNQWEAGCSRLESIMVSDNT